MSGQRYARANAEQSGSNFRDGKEDAKRSLLVIRLRDALSRPDATCVQWRLDRRRVFLIVDVVAVLANISPGGI